MKKELQLGNILVDKFGQKGLVLLRIINILENNKVNDQELFKITDNDFKRYCGIVRNSSVRNYLELLSEIDIIEIVICRINGVKNRLVKFNQSKVEELIGC